MERGIIRGWSIKLLLVVIVAALATGCGNKDEIGNTQPSDKFETLRAYIQTWLSEAGDDWLLISSSQLKEEIVDDWGNQREKCQIVSVRKPDDYNGAGHIPDAINIYWTDIILDKSLARFGSHNTLILYCYYGHGSMISATMLSLLGYRCNSLDFGMMDWNLDALVKEPWDQRADYDMETAVNRPKKTYPPPIIMSDQPDAKSIIKEMARKYLAGEGSPIIRSASIKAIIDNWNHKKGEYQIVDVRSERDYEAGHVPHAINIPWAGIAEIENLRKLDPNRTVIVCSDNGQTGQLATTVLNLLDYDAVNMLFGMMDWNKAYVDVTKQWDGVTSYSVEY